MSHVPTITVHYVISIILSGISVLIFEKKITLTSNNAQARKDDLELDPGLAWISQYPTPSGYQHIKAL